jgi:hypothetical protein
MVRNMPRPSGSSGKEATGDEGDPANPAGAGFRAVAQTIVDTEFPVERTQLEETIGEEEVELTQGRRVSMREILSQLPDERFETDVDFRRALEENWDGISSLGGPDTREGREEETPVRRETTRSPRGSTKKKAAAAKRLVARGPKVNRGRTSNRNAGAKGGQRDPRKARSNRGGNERAGGRGGNQRPAGRARQQQGSKTQRASRQRKQALGARNKRTRGSRTGAVRGARRTRATSRKR